MGFTTALAIISLGLGLLHLLRLATARRDGRSVPGEASHAAMGLGMAAMLSPTGDPLPAAVWLVVFGAVAAWSGQRWARSGPAADDAAHHTVCAVAMLLMVAVGGHSHGHAAPAWVSLVAIVLAGYFGWHVLRCADRVTAARRAPVPAGHAGCAAPAGGAGLRAPYVGALAHLVMAASMGVVFLGML
ncbi:MAG: DUF5134 domain-containing protein [Pseudonocardia sp.]|nr:DUF5134 domain-containing protein [Pseudonocardia sp.]